VITVAWAGSSLTVTVIQAAGVGIDDPTVIPIPAISVYPNPFATSANIKVDVTNNNNAELVVYSSKGELVKTLGIYSKGSYTLTWDGKDKAGRQVSNGFYLIRYKSADLTKTVKVLLIRN
jgi:flagellar hook assembly protein FlgD